MRYIGFDVGGTKCAVTVATVENDKVTFEGKHAFLTPEAWQEAVEQMFQAAEALLGDKKADACGFSCGSPLDAEKGIVLAPPNLPTWDHVPVTELARARFGIPAFLENDANACALAEWQFGAGRGCNNMVFLTFGTGMGAGLILDGRLYAGTNGMAGEAGHIRLAEDGPVGYGKAGSMEGFCSGGGLAQLAQMRMGRALTARELCALAEAGDAQAVDALRLSARMLGRGLAVLIDLINPQRIVIGSIFARAEKWFRPEMEAEIAREALVESRSVCQVVPAQLGDRIGDVAAITVAWNG